jgi:hypothetical protein
MLKADGKGLPGGLASFDTELASNPKLGPLKIRNRRGGFPPSWLLYDLALDAGFAGALAVRTDMVAPVLRHCRLGNQGMEQPTCEALTL